MAPRKDIVYVNPQGDDLRQEITANLGHVEEGDVSECVDSPEILRMIEERGDQIFVLISPRVIGNDPQAGLQVTKAANARKVPHIALLTSSPVEDLRSLAGQTNISVLGMSQHRPRAALLSWLADIRDEMQENRGPSARKVASSDRRGQLKELMLSLTAAK